MARRLMCREGARLKGRSFAASGAKKGASHPSTGGLWNAKWSGKSRKQMPEAVMAKRIRAATVWSSRRDRQRKTEAAKKRSIDMYGRMKTGTKGICRSHSQ